MARILSRDRDKDPYNEDEAERRILQSKPVCFIIFGKPGSGKTTLARKLAKVWKCELVNGEVALLQAMEMSTELGLKAQSILMKGEALSEEFASQLLEDKIASPEVIHHGYVLDGFPSLCEDWISIKEQLELMKSWKYTPDFIINLKIPDKDLEIRMTNQKVDPVTNKIYPKEFYEPEMKGGAGDDKEDEEDDEGEEEEVNSEILDEEEEDEDDSALDEEFPEEIISRLVYRPEDILENVQSSIKKYKDLMLRMLEDYMVDHDQLKVIEVDANLSPKAIFKSVMLKLSTFGVNHAFTTLPLQGEEDSEEIPKDADSDDLLRSLAASEMIAPKFRWRRSRWGRLCPVELFNGNIVQGLPLYSVSFLDKIYCMSSNETLATFIRNPRPFLTSPLPCPPCKVCIIGPPCAGKTTLAKRLARRYQAQYFDLDLLMKSKKEIAKAKLMKEVEDEALEAAIAKVTINVQIAKEEEEERLEKAEKDKEDEEGVNDQGEEEEEEDDENNKKEVNEIDEKKSDLVPVDQNHPEVMKLVQQALSDAEDREPDIAAEEYVEVVEEAIQARLKEVDEARSKEQRIGCYVVDNFPFTREQFTLMIERGFVPDSFVCLTDDSPNGSYLSERYVKLQTRNKSEEHVDDIDSERSAAEEESKSSVEETASKALENYQTSRIIFDNNCQQLLAIVKGANNVELTMIACDKDKETMLEEAIKAVEGTFCYTPWEYTAMDEDEEEEDAADDDDEEFLEEEETDVFNRDFRRKMLGDNKHYCAVMLKENGVLWPGVPECAAKYREKVYYFSSPDSRRRFLDDPTQYLPIDRPLQPPPIRLFIIGPKGAGKTLHGRYLAEKLGLFHIDFKERLQELIISKTKKRVGSEYEENETTTTTTTTTVSSEPKENENKEEDEEEMQLTEEEEYIHAYLTEGDAMQREVLEKIISPWWNEEPFKSRGFILEGFPNVEDEVRLISTIGLFPDAAIILAVEDNDIVKRLLPEKMEKWCLKRDKREAEKQRLREIAMKAKAELRAKRKEELVIEYEARQAEKLQRAAAKKDSDDDDDDEDDEDGEGEDDNMDIEAILDGEFEDGDEEEEEEDETEEEAVERIKMEIVDLYEEQIGKIAVVQETLEEIMVPRLEIDSSRSPHIVRYCLEKTMKSIVEYRESLFERCLPIEQTIAHRMLVQGYKFISRFGKWCPVKLLNGEVMQPYVPPGGITYPVVYRQYIYYLSSEKARNLFVCCPTKYLKQPTPKPVVAMKMAIIGPPKSGKTTLAKRFASEYGLVVLSIGEVLRRLLSMQYKTTLAQQIHHHLIRGCTVPDELAIQALQIILLDMQCQVRGFILDGYPISKQQLELMTDKSIIPIKVIELSVSDVEILKRANLDRKARSYPMHDSRNIISIKTACWKNEIGAVRDWYQNVQRNWININGEQSKWMVWNNAVTEAKRNVAIIQTYLARILDGKAASVSDMCITPKEFTERLGDFNQYCPVSLADYGHLVDCSHQNTLEFAAEYRGRYYKLQNKKELEKFLSNPSCYVAPLAPCTLPPLEMLPKQRNVAQLKENFPCRIELQGYCPVTYLDGKKRYEAIVTGNPQLIVEYCDKFYIFESEVKLDKFMRTPEKYHGLSLPMKLPPKVAPLNTLKLPILGFLEQTVAATVTKALTAVGCFKPKYPFLNARSSALLYLAYHLKAFNPKSNEFVQEKYKTKLKKFEERCQLIKYLGDRMTDTYTLPENRPFDFDNKMKNFLELKTLKPTFA